MRDFTRVFAAFLYENRKMCVENMSFCRNTKEEYQRYTCKMAALYVYLFLGKSSKIYMLAFKFYNFRDINL